MVILSMIMMMIRYHRYDSDDRYDSVRLCKILTLTRTVVTIAAVLSFNPFL